MHWEFIVALIIAIPVILFPAAVVWYFNFGGIYTALKKNLNKKNGKATVPGEDYENGRQTVPVIDEEFDGKY
jgi:hypothetical protein